MENTLQAIKQEIKKVIVGQEELVDAMLIGLLSGGHILVEGVPGLAKTTAINALSKALGLDFKRVQFTPDLLPADVIGTEIYDQKNGDFKIKHGPIFTNLLLADEINRAPAKVQSALLEAMQEKQVTIGDESFTLSLPFLVMATQNPLEHEGTYRLPEAQLDRFLMKIIVGYNSFEEEMEVVNRVVQRGFESIVKVADAQDILHLQQQLSTIHIDEALQRYMLQIIFATRSPKAYGLESLETYIHFGASPRASIDLLKASKALALIRGKDYVSPYDVAEVVSGVLRHRIILNYQAEAEDISVDFIIKKIMQTIKVP
ncbi:MoxR family ATPase [Sulfurospirillum diekertiae]|uniref:MoxR family ATPase n=1 Tax=Sulfurospirillum diekertiae TaxID=1854492 RepID=A0A6G9VSE9_9BACT|nr:MoxR family ATPase [Sulfurospirillum diekertiae]QIR75683.1 MoxR family ATPase [Sulfurospirillum diekertiae]QIR78330.1 MoxR family ATPase [Sulfurospirillum diekertiae]